MGKGATYVPDEKTLCIAGKARIAVETLDIAYSSGLNVITCPVASDLGEDSWQPSLRKFAASRSIALVTPEDCYSIQNLVFISVEYDRLIAPALFASSDLFNIHFSLLPAYKGCLTSVWPIYHAEEKTGVTLHRIDRGIDTGPIVAQIEIPLTDNLTSRELYEIYQDCGVTLFSQSLARLVEGDVEAEPQGYKGSSYFPRRSLEDISFEINFHDTAEQIKNFVRALYFPEFQTATHLGKPVRSAKISGRRSTKNPGTLLSQSRDSALVTTVDFDIRLVYKNNPDRRGL